MGPVGRGLTRDGTFSRPQMSPRYLQSNSSSHTRPFSAIAELLGEWRGLAGPRVASLGQQCQRGAVDATGMHEARGAGPLGAGWGASATVFSRVVVGGVGLDLVRKAQEARCVWRDWWGSCTLVLSGS